MRLTHISRRFRDNAEILQSASRLALFVEAAPKTSRHVQPDVTLDHVRSACARREVLVALTDSTTSPYLIVCAVMFFGA